MGHCLRRYLTCGGPEEKHRQRVTKGYLGTGLRLTVSWMSSGPGGGWGTADVHRRQRSDDFAGSSGHRYTPPSGRGSGSDSRGRRRAGHPRLHRARPGRSGLRARLRGDRAGGLASRPGRPLRPDHPGPGHARDDGARGPRAAAGRAPGPGGGRPVMPGRRGLEGGVPGARRAGLPDQAVLAGRAARPGQARVRPRGVAENGHDRAAEIVPRAWAASPWTLGTWSPTPGTARCR